MSKYILIVRDRISTSKPCTDETLERLNCIYKSPEFLWDGSYASADAIIEKFRAQFNHMLDWNASFISVS